MKYFVWTVPAALVIAIIHYSPRLIDAVNAALNGGAIPR